MTAPTAPAGGTSDSLNGARSLLGLAEDALSGWYARQATETHTYVHEGHVAIRFIDQLLVELHRVRGALVGEIRADEDERAARVDRMLAQWRAERPGREPAHSTGDGLDLSAGGAA